MLIEIHMLKNYPPVNLNRDDSGAPKSCFFGGVQRGRISSQCLKRSWRTSDTFRTLGSYGIRTRSMPALVGERLTKMGISQEYVEEAVKKLTGVANKEGTINKKGSITSQIVIYSEEEIERIVQAVKAAIEKDGSVKAFVKRTPKEFDQLRACAKDKPITADIALFGRMVTCDAFRVEQLVLCGICQTPPHVEIHKTALGAEALMEKLVPVLLRAMAYTNPSGKQNTFAGQVLPDLVMVECKKDKIPLSYVNAFEEPVSAWGNQPNLVKKSIEKLTAHVDCMDYAYELPVLHRAFFAPRFTETQPKACDVYDQFTALAKACAGWLQEDDIP